MHDREKPKMAPDFDGAIAPNQTDEERSMSSDILSKVDTPFKTHNLYSENEFAEVDIDRLLRPILQKHEIGLSDYDPYTLSFQVGKKTIQLNVSDYEKDNDFEDVMFFGREPFNLIKTLKISNRSSIKGTEILVDFLKAFQEKFSDSFFDVGGGAWVEKDEMQDLYVDGVMMHDPDLTDIMEIEDPEVYVEEMQNGKQ